MDALRRSTRISKLDRKTVGPVAIPTELPDWTVRGSNPGGGEIFRTCRDRLRDPPSLLYNGYRVFLRGKVRPGCDIDHSPPSSVEVIEE
jgi:hypothetical protein